MALNCTGPIAIGGCTSGVSIAKELGLTTTAQHSLNCTSYRTLSGQSSGAVSMNAFHGKSNVIKGSQSYTTPGTYTFVVPSGVTSISVLTVGGGSGAYQQGGGGGALAYGNSLSVTPGTSYCIVVGVGGAGSRSYPPNAGGRSSFNYGCACVRVYANGGNGTGTNAIGGSSGFSSRGSGAGGKVNTSGCLTGGGGAGGFSAGGGDGGNSNSNGTAGSCGAGGGGGGGARISVCCCTGAHYFVSGGGGGGVGLYGKGSNGSAGTFSSSSVTGGGAGSSGASGGNGTKGANCCCCAIGGSGGNYGGGGGGGYTYSGRRGGNGGSGAVRIVWPGCSRQFPSTCVGTP